MRISIIGPAYPLRGGIAHHVYWLQQELARRGHNVQGVSFRKLYPRLLFPGTTELDTSRLKLDSGATPILTPLNPLTWRRAFKLVKAFSPDAVVFQWWQPFFGPLVGTLARWFRRAGVSCIIECHNVFPHERRPLDGLLVRFALSAADHLITHSTRDREKLLSVVPGKEVSVSPLPCLNVFSSSSEGSRSGRTILFFGKVRKYKGLDVLLAALPTVLSKVECKLIVVGEFYDSINRYQRLIREHRIENYVHIDNRYIPNEEVPGVFERADVLVLPYLSATQSAVARIALSNRLPVIASRTGGLSEAVTENVNGLLFPPGDADALAGRIVSYFTNNLGPVFSENILKAAGDQSSRQLGDVIEEILLGGRDLKLEGTHPSQSQ
jgi:glycosyltransferase involved in cell wall biosynthesis